MVLGSSYCGNCVVSPGDFSLGTRGAAIYHNRATSSNMQQWAEKACKVVRKNWATMDSWNKNTFTCRKMFYNVSQFRNLNLSWLLGTLMHTAQMYCKWITHLLFTENVETFIFYSYLSKSPLLYWANYWRGGDTDCSLSSHSCHSRK